MCKEPFILNGVSYTRKQKNNAFEIRRMPEGDQKEFRKKFFEGGTGKKFPESEPIELALNIDTAFPNSRQIQGEIEQCVMNTRKSRMRLPL